MGELFLVLLLVCIVCGSLPLLMTAYMSGRLKISKWIVNALAFFGITIIAILRFPLKLSYGNPVTYLGALIVYFFIGQFLRKEYTRKKWYICMLLVFAANCVGIFLKYLISQFLMERIEYSIGWNDVSIFFVLTQVVVFIAYFFTSDK